MARSVGTWARYSLGAVAVEAWVRVDSPWQPLAGSGNNCRRGCRQLAVAAVVDADAVADVGTGRLEEGPGFLKDASSLQK